jgi:3-oxoacyl-[acyl-carrier protein] reductase
MRELDAGLAGKTTLISGASRGIGRGIAVAAASKGSKVICVGRTLEKDGTRGSLRETVDMIQSTGGEAIPFYCDVSKPDEIVDLFKNISSQLGDIDILVNNAGIYTAGSIQNISLDDWSLGLAVNLTAPMLISKLAIPMMINNGGGVILNITSGSAERYDRKHVAYSISKAALNRFTQNLAQEVSNLNIVVNALEPGLVKTEMNGFYEGGDEIESVIEPALKLMALTIDENISGQILHKDQYR